MVEDRGAKEVEEAAEEATEVPEEARQQPTPETPSGQASQEPLTFPHFKVAGNTGNLGKLQDGVKNLSHVLGNNSLHPKKIIEILTNSVRTVKSLTRCTKD